MLFSPFHTCKIVHPVLDLPQHNCVLLKYDKKKYSPSLRLIRLPYYNMGEGAESKTGASISLYAVNIVCIDILLSYIKKRYQTVLTLILQDYWRYSTATMSMWSFMQEIIEEDDAKTENSWPVYVHCAPRAS